MVVKTSDGRIPHYLSHTLRGHGDAVWALQNRKSGASGPPKRADWVALAEQVVVTAVS